MAMTTLFRFSAPAIFVVLIEWIGGCSSDQACAYNEKSYPEGASFRSADGCNTCSCVAQGRVECTLAACLGDAGFAPPSDTAAPDTRDGAIDGGPADQALPSDTDRLDGSMPMDGSAQADYCQLPMALTFYPQQEFRVPSSPASYTDRYRLDSNALVITRSFWNGYDAQFERTCMPPLPLCGLADQVTVWNMGVDLANPDVKAAFIAPDFTLFGAAPGPSDAWVIASDAGGRILVGQPCPSSDPGTCRTLPPSLQRLRDDLQALVTAMAAQPTCVELLQP
jgi:hypothetical protein